MSFIPSTDPAHLLANAWQFKLYTEAGEGTGVLRSRPRKAHEYVAKGFAADPDRAASEAGRRARKNLRLYCTANRLNRLGTLTYAGAGCHEPALIRQHLGLFFRQLRQVNGGRPFPYVWVPEWHKSGHGLHAHFAIGQYISRRHIDQAWGHGFVHIKLLGDLPVGSGTLGEARQAAGYLSKYIAKEFTEVERRAFGFHRYDSAQGFRPEPILMSGPSAFAVLSAASEYQGGQPVTEWSSSSNEDWPGPPTIWAQWGR